MEFLKVSILKKVIGKDMFIFLSYHNVLIMLPCLRVEDAVDNDKKDEDLAGRNEDDSSEFD